MTPTLSKQKLALMWFLLLGLISASGWVVTKKYLNFSSLGGDFSLLSEKGPLSLKDLRGYAVVLYFGYTSCPDICPMSLHRLSNHFAKLDEKERTQIIPVFVSVDTRGDTTQRVQLYVSNFFKNGIGLIGSKAQLDQVTLQYGTNYLIEEAPKTALGYSVMHGDRFYLIDRKGRLKWSLPSSAPESEFILSLKTLL